MTTGGGKRWSAEAAERGMARLLLGVLAALIVSASQAQPSDLPACVQDAIAAGAPKEVANAMYLMEWMSPMYMAGLACRAKQAGTKIRFKVKGWFSQDSFEIVGKRRLRVTLDRHVMEESGALLLVPVAYELDGRSYEVGRQNLGLLAHQIRTVLSNE